MKVSKTLIHSFGIVSLLSMTACKDAVVPTGVENCVMPQESIFELRNVTSENGTNPNVAPEVDLNKPVRECDIPDKVSDDDDNNNDDDNSTDNDDTTPVIQELDINAKLKKFTHQQEVKMREALKRLKVIINSQDFKDAVLAHTYKGSKTYVQNNGLTNAQIYDKIMLGAEKLLPEVDHEIDLDIELYYSSKNVVGYTYPNVLQIWVNKKYFNTNSYGAVAANVIHEWLHKVGFGHDYKRTSRRPYSVPYGIGSIMKDLVNKM